MKFGLLAALVQPILLIAMTIYGHAPIFWGKDIVVKTQLYDPRDLFRGNYVSLSYDFNRHIDIDDDSQYMDKHFIERNVYALLKEDENGTYYMQNLSLSKPKEGVFLLGKITRYDSAIFGVEAYFLPKDKALAMEAKMSEFDDEKVKDDKQRLGKKRKYTAFAHLKVLENGMARIDGLELINNKTGEKTVY